MPAASVSGFLDNQGRRAFPADFSGSLDPADFKIVLGEDGAKTSI
jgi:hypothetical protein